MWTRRVASSAFRRCLKVRTVGHIDALRGDCLLGAFCFFPLGWGGGSPEIHPFNISD
jgi:hypothetical protein